MDCTTLKYLQNQKQGYNKSMSGQLSFINLLNGEDKSPIVILPQKIKKKRKRNPYLENIQKLHYLYMRLYTLIGIYSQEEMTIHNNFYLWHEDSEAEIRGSQFLSDEKKIEVHQKEIERLESGNY